MKQVSGTTKSAKMSHQRANPQETHQLLNDVTHVFQRNFNTESDVDLQSLSNECWNPDFSVSEVEKELSRLNPRKATGRKGACTLIT